MVELLEPIARVLFFGIGYAVGFFPVLLGSLGSVEPGPIDRIGDSSFYRSKSEKGGMSLTLTKAQGICQPRELR